MNFLKNTLFSATTLLLLIEITTLAVLLCILGYLYYSFDLDILLSATSYLIIMPALSIGFFMILFGAYDPIARIDMDVFAVRHRAASITGALCAWLYAYIYVPEWVSPLYGIVTAGVAYFGIQIVRGFAKTYYHLTPLQRRVFLIGNTSVSSGPEKIPNLVGNMTFYQASNEEMLLKEIKDLNVNEIIIGSETSYRDLPTDTLLECKTRGIKITPYVSYFERRNKRVSLDHIYPQWFIFTSGFHYTSLDRVLKRSIDLVFSVAGFVVALPAMLIVMLLIKLTSPGPVFYDQVRIGLNGRPFSIRKFRSMRVDAEQSGTAQWAQSNDTRVTPVGRFIRKTRLDELPQLFNILTGEMSLVGPRPERPVFVEQLSEKIPYYRDRHRVKPGLTGWAQVNYPYGASEEDARMKLAYDLYYMKNYSITLDIITMFKTVRVVLFGDGAR